MNPVLKSMQSHEPPQDHDEAVLGAMAEADVNDGAVADARASGISWVAIFRLIAQHGPRFLEVLKLIMAARGMPFTDAEPVVRRPRRRRDPEPDDPTAPEATTAPGS